MYIFHEGLDVVFWNLEVGQLVYGVLMDGSSYTGSDGNERVGFHPLFFMVLISGSYMVCLCERSCSGICHNSM